MPEEQQEPTLEELLEQLKDSRNWIRAKSAKKLGDLVNEKAVVPLLDLLDDRDIWVKNTVVDALKKLHAEDSAIERLINKLSEEKGTRLKRTINALVRCGKRAIEPLLGALMADDFETRRGAVLALRGIGDFRAVEPLIMTLKDDNEVVRAEAIRAIDKFKDRRAIEPLLSILNSQEENYEMKCLATQALGNINDKRVINIQILRQEFPLLSIINSQVNQHQEILIDLLPLL